MKEPEDLLRQWRPTPKRPLKAEFTKEVLLHLEKPRNSASERLQTLFVQLLRLPKFALLILAVVVAGSLSTGVYAAYQWAIPKISILFVNPNNDHNNREFLVNVEDCGVMVGGETANNGAQRFEVSRQANLSDEQVMRVLQNSCQYQQALQFMNTEWSDGGAPPEGVPGQVITLRAPGAGGFNIKNDPWFGTVTALSDTQITIESTIYSFYNGPKFIPAGDPIPDFNKLTEYYPGGKSLTRTFDLVAAPEIVENGQPVNRDQLKVGDRVLFMSEVARTILPDLSWSEPTSIRVIRLMKTAIEPEYVQPFGIGNPSIVGAIARLDGCQGNGDYLCVVAKHEYLRYKMIYLVQQMSEAAPDPRFDGNEKYLRSDINNQNMSGEHFHQIEGRLLSIDGTAVTLQARGKADTFKVTLPYDAVKKFNETQDSQVKVGDMVQINYAQQPAEDHRTVNSGDILSFALLQRQQGDGSLVSY